MALFFSFFRSQRISVCEFPFFVTVQATEQGGTWSEKRKKIEKKYFNILYKKESFYLLNNVHHGDKHKINNSIFEHKTTSAT
jgi:hypothetical protein